MAPIKAQYYLAHIKIVDVETGGIMQDQNVYVNGNRISSISSQAIKNPASKVYDCTGKFLIPGLWDMHIHDGGDDSSNRFEYVPLFIANGVTGIRDMWGSPEMLKLKADIEAGNFVGPRTVHSVRDGAYMVHTEPLVVDPKKFRISRAVLKKFVDNRAAVVPTLTLAQGRGIGGGQMAQQTKGLEYFTRETIDYWIKTPPALPQAFIQTFGAAAKFLADNGVLILAGTDVNNPFCLPGFALQQELINLHAAGLTNLQALQAATLNPAKFLYRENELGSVTAGKLADLLVLDDDPLADISNTQKINAVVVNGKYLSKDDIQRILDTQRKR